MADAVVRAIEAVAELRAALGPDDGIRLVLGERIAALLEEFAWESGIVREEG